MQNNSNSANLTQYSNYQQNIQNTQLDEYSKTYKLLDIPNLNITNLSQDEINNLFQIQAQNPQISQTNLQSYNMPSLAQIARSSNLSHGYAANTNQFQINLNSQSNSINNNNFTQIANNNNNTNNNYTDYNGILNSNNQIPLTIQTQYSNPNYNNNQFYLNSDANMKSMNYENYSSYSANNPKINNFNNFSSSSNNPNNFYSYNSNNNNQFQSQLYPLSGGSSGDSASVYSGMSGSTYFSNAKSVNNLTRKVMKDEVNTRLLECLDSLLPKLAEECAEYIYDKFKKEFSQQNSELEEIRKLVDRLEENFSVKIETKFLNENSTPMKNLFLANENISIIQKNLERKVEFFIGNEDEKNCGYSGEELDVEKTGIIPLEMVRCGNFFGEMKKKITGFKLILEKERCLANEINQQIIDGNAGFIQVKKLFEDKVPLINEKFKLLKSREVVKCKDAISSFALKNNNQNEKQNKDADGDFADKANKPSKSSKAADENTCFIFYKPLSKENNYKNINNGGNSKTIELNLDYDNNYNDNNHLNENECESNLEIFNKKLNNLLENYSTLKNQISSYIEQNKNTDKKKIAKNEKENINLNLLNNDNAEYTEKLLYPEEDAKSLASVNKQQQKHISKEIKFSDLKNPFLATKKCIEKDSFIVKTISLQDSDSNNNNKDNFSIIPLVRKQNSLFEEGFLYNKKPNFRKKPQNIKRQVQASSIDYNEKLFENNDNNIVKLDRKKTFMNIDNNKNKINIKDAFNNLFRNNTIKQSEVNLNGSNNIELANKIHKINRRKVSEKVANIGLSKKMIDCSFKF